MQEDQIANKVSVDPSLRGVTVIDSVPFFLRGQELYKGT